MALPSTGIITAAMINTELGRATNTAISLNDAAVRALAGKTSGVISFADLRGKSSEILVTVATGSSNYIIKNLFSAADWASDTAKRVRVPAGVEWGAPSNRPAGAIAISDSASGLAGSFGGSLTLENSGIISGCGGAANGGGGGDAIYANFTGKSGQKLQIINNGTIRGGGGGGGRGGNGGTGGGGSVATTVRNPASGHHYNNNTYKWYIYTPNEFNWYHEIRWNNVLVHSVQTPYESYINLTQVNTNIGVVYRGTQAALDGYGIPVFGVFQQTAGTTNTNGGAGGAGANGAVGQGYGQAAGVGPGGTAGAVGGTNAGRGGTGGKGGNGGAYGAAGIAGAVGATGANGNRTNGVAGAGGAAGGAAGRYINGNANVTWVTTGTRLGGAV